MIAIIIIIIVIIIIIIIIFFKAPFSGFELFKYCCYIFCKRPGQFKSSAYENSTWIVETLLKGYDRRIRPGVKGNFNFCLREGITKDQANAEKIGIFHLTLKTTIPIQKNCEISKALKYLNPFTGVSRLASISYGRLTLQPLFLDLFFTPAWANQSKERRFETMVDRSSSC